ncbi:MAG: potassium-transporting ATPase subunit C, partial [Oscillospiraceae bacterium]
MPFNDVWKSVKFLLLMTVLCGALYTGVVTAAAQLLFPKQANGSLIEIDGKKYGCELLGQQYTDQAHLWGRIMQLDVSTFTDRDGQRRMYAVPSNLSPASAEFEALVAARVDILRAANPELEEA